MLSVNDLSIETSTNDEQPFGSKITKLFHPLWTYLVMRQEARSDLSKGRV